MQYCLLPMVPTTICHVSSTGAGSSSTVVTSLTGTADNLVLLLLLLVDVVLAFLNPKSQLFLTVIKGQFCVTIFFVKEGKEQQTTASMITN